MFDVPRRRSSARHFIVSSGNMKNKPGQPEQVEEKTCAGGHPAGPGCSFPKSGEDKAHDAEKHKHRRDVGAGVTRTSGFRDSAK